VSLHIKTFYIIKRKKIEVPSAGGDLGVGL
jgi:hypothetical protein